MSDNNKDAFPSRAVFRGKMLVASFPEATPPVLWRWLASDVSSGFGLRKAEGRVELLRYDSGTTAAVVASFASLEAGERALARLSNALIQYRAPWKQVVAWALAIIGTALVIGAVLYGLSWAEFNLQHSAASTRLRQVEQAARTSSSGRMPETIQQQQQRQLPQQANKPPETPTGSAVDVDSVYH